LGNGRSDQERVLEETRTVLPRVHPARRRQARGGLLTFADSASPAKKAKLNLAMSHWARL